MYKRQHYNRGLLRAQVGDDNRAIEDFDFVLKMEPDNMMATFNRGLLRAQTDVYKRQAFLCITPFFRLSSFVFANPLLTGVTKTFLPFY